MAFKLEDHFRFSNTNPSSLQQDNIVQFSYKSPTGVHDSTPVVLVHEKLGDRFYGINLHYDLNAMNQAITNVEKKILKHLEESYFKKYPDNKKKLNESHQKFTKSLVTEGEYNDFMRNFKKDDLEQFLVEKIDMSACRLYIYSRMNSVSKCVFKG